VFGFVRTDEAAQIPVDLRLKLLVDVLKVHRR
jgi:hypothetical protein